MKHNIILLWILLLAAGIILAPLVSAASESSLPPGLLKAKEFNMQFSEEILHKVSLFIAFLAGVTSIVSPCILPILPAYFAVTFGERKRITLATCLFFMGFAPVFIGMGLVATAFGKTVITLFQDEGWIVRLAGIGLILLGMMTLLGKGFHGVVIRRKMVHGGWGLLVSGALFALGWTACIGPILSGLLIMAGTLGNYGWTALLMLFYSIGIFVPLFLLSFFYATFHLEKLAFFNQQVTLWLRGKAYTTTYPQMIAGILFVVLGFVFLIFRGTAIVNGFQMFGLREYFYTWQRIFLDHTAVFTLVSVVAFVVFFIMLATFLWKELYYNDNQQLTHKQSPSDKSEVGDTCGGIS